MFRNFTCLLVLATAVFAQSNAGDEAQVWNLEKAYWEYAKANDLEKYRGLWHEDFVGWPTSSSTPMRKDHITDWITRNTSKGVKMQSYAIEQLAIQVRMLGGSDRGERVFRIERHVRGIEDRTLRSRICRKSWWTERR